MKPMRLILQLMLFAVTTSAFAQSPQRFNYQAVARDASGNAISEKTLGVQISILDNTEAGTTLYTETFNPKTTKQGLFSVQVGGGSATVGSFAGIVWGSSPKFLKVEIDPAGGTSFELLGTSQLLSVPYALAADRLASPLSITELSDVSDVVPMTDQVLKWDGTEWTPGTGSSMVTSTEFSGSGTTDDPLRIAPQGATSGQVLQWSGVDWKPASLTGGVGDNWGTQSVVTSTALSGVGTGASPLTIAQQGATNGQVLGWNGIAWAPSTIGGDNWGTAKVNTSALFEGDGTPGNPLKLSTTAAAVGQTLMFNGTTWAPEFLNGTIALPFTSSAANASPLFQVTNSTGNSIKGIVNSTNSNIAGVEGVVANASAGAESAGVIGRNIATTANGYGVAGFHSGTGVAVYGEVGGAGVGVSAKAGANGIAMYGGSTGANSYGVVGLGGIGVSGTSNTSAGKGIYGNATAGGYAGWFDGRSVIRSNSTTTDANLLIWEDDANDKARIRFNNGVVGESWDIGAITPAAGGVSSDRLAVTHFSGGDILTVTGDKRVGINVSNPSTSLDINGGLRVAGNIVANDAPGTNGQVLQSDGTKVVWGYGTIGLYNNTLLADQVNSHTNITTEIAPDGLNNLQFTTTKASRVSFTFSHSQLVSNGTGDVDLQVEIGFKDVSTGTIINRTFCDDVILNNKKKTFSFTHHCAFNSAGSFKPYVVVRTTNGKGFNVIGGGSNGQVTVFIVQQ